MTNRARGKRCEMALAREGECRAARSNDEGRMTNEQLSGRRGVEASGTEAAMAMRMKNFFPAGMLRGSQLSRIGLVASALAGLASCSKTDVNLASQPSPQPVARAAADGT